MTSTVTVAIAVELITGSPPTPDARVIFEMTATAIVAQTIVMPGPVEAPLADDGTGTAHLIPSPPGTAYRVTVRDVFNRISVAGYAFVPNADCNLADILTTAPPLTVNGRDLYGGYPGLTGFALDLKNQSGTALSFLQSAATAPRTWSLPDKSGTLLTSTDIAPSIPAIIGFDATGTPDGADLFFAGRSVANDGGGGAFFYSAASVQPADNVMVFAPTGGGRLFRQGWTVVGFNGPISAAWAGAIPDGSDMAVPLQRWLDSIPRYGVAVLPSGIYGTAAPLLRPYARQSTTEGYGAQIKALVPMDHVLEVDERGPGGDRTYIFLYSGSAIRGLTLDGNNLADYTFKQTTSSRLRLIDFTAKNGRVADSLRGNSFGAVCGDTLSINCRFYKETDFGQACFLPSYVRNSANLTGAAVGTPGVLPDHWGVALTGDASYAITAITPLSFLKELVATFAATAGGTIKLYFEDANYLAAAQGQRYTARMRQQLLAVTSGSITATELGIEEVAADGTILRDGSIGILPAAWPFGTALSQIPSTVGDVLTQEINSTSFVQDPAAAFVRPYVKYTLAAGTNVSVAVAFPRIFRSSDLGAYNLWVTNGSDGRDVAMIAYNASLANIQDDAAGMNFYNEIHAYGAPPEAVPLFNYVLDGGASISDCSADTAVIGGYYFSSGGIEASNIHTQRCVRGVVAKTGTGRLTLIGGQDLQATADQKAVAVTLDAYYNVTPGFLNRIDGNMILRGGASGGNMIPGALNTGAIQTGSYGWAFGYFSRASGAYSTAFGRNGDTDGQQGKFALGFGAPFGFNNASQRGSGGMTATSVSGVPVRLTCDGIPANLNSTNLWKVQGSSQIARMHKLEIHVAAMCETGECAGWKVTGALYSSTAGGAAFVAGPTIVQEYAVGATAGAWALTVAADNVFSSLDIRGAGVGTGGKVVRWVASISSTEIGAPVTP